LARQEGARQADGEEDGKEPHDGAHHRSM